MIPDLGALTTINVDAYDTGDDLAKEVSKKINLPTDMFKLVSAGSVIKSEIRLNQQNLKPGMPIKILTLYMDILKVGALARRKNSKHHFLRDISKSFQEVTPIDPEPHQFFSFSNISTNMVARGIKSFGQNGLWLAG